MTGGSTVGHQDPEKDISVLFDNWKGYLKEAGICESLSKADRLLTSKLCLLTPEFCLLTPEFPIQKE